VNNFRRAGNFVARILGGAKPADTPIEAPATFDLIINLKTAAQIGVSIPPSLLAGATRVVE
jgi:putative ABC transport system substrate-binding protein